MLTAQQFEILQMRNKSDENLIKIKKNISFKKRKIKKDEQEKNISKHEYNKRNYQIVAI